MSPKNTSVEPTIHEAARLGDTSLIENLLSKGVDINERINMGSYYDSPHLIGLTPLIVAASSNEGATAETLRFLLERGADLHARSESGASVVWYAVTKYLSSNDNCIEDCFEKLKLLAEFGADLHNTGGYRSILLEATAMRNVAMLRYLLEKGFSPHPDEPKLLDYRIPIFCAARSGSAECVRLLLETGSDPHVCDKSFNTVLMNASSPEVMKVLLEAGVDIFARNEYGDDALDVVLRNEEEYPYEQAKSMASVLIQAGADIDGTNPNKRNRLRSRAFSMNADGVEILCELGVNLEVIEEELPLHAVCWQGEYSCQSSQAEVARIIDVLIKNGILIDSQDDEGRTPLHKATGGDWGSPIAVKTLLKHGAPLDIQDDYGVTPLMLAARSGELGCIELLLEAGANLDLEDNDGWSALDYAKDNEEIWEKIAWEELQPKNKNKKREMDKKRIEHYQRTMEKNETLQEARKCVRIIDEAVRKISSYSPRQDLDEV